MDNEMNVPKLNKISKAILEQFQDKPAIVFLAIFLVFSIIFAPNFTKPDNLLNIMTQSADLIILACGMTFIFVNGSMDLSMTAVLGLSSIFGAMVLTKEGNPYLLIILAIIVMMATGMGIGLMNGMAVAYLKMPSFIATMATQLVFSGVALTITQSTSIGGIPVEFNHIAQGRFLGVPIPIIIMLVVIVICTFVLTMTVFGRRVIAIGINQKTATISGIPVKKTIVSIFVISSALATLASIVMTARLGAGLPALGSDMMMDIVGAVVIGGTVVTGGKGNMIGTAIGAIFVITLNNCLNLLEVQWYFINVSKGLLILVVALYMAIRARSSRT